MIKMVRKVFDGLMKSKFLSDGIWIISLDIFKKIVKIALIYVLVRELSMEDFGNYQYVLSIVQLIGVFALPGGDIITLQSVARGHHGIFRLVTMEALKLSFIGGIFLLLIGVYYTLYANQVELGWCFFTCGLFFPLAYGLDKWKAFYQGLGQFKESSVMEGSRLAIIDAFLIVLALIMKTYILLGIIIGFMVLQSLMNFVYYKRVRNSKVENDSIEKSSKEYMYKTTFYSGFNIVANTINGIIIYNFYSAEILAIYSAADKIPEVLKKSIQSISKVFTSRFSKYSTLANNLMTRINQFSIITAIFIIVFAVFILPTIMRLLLTDSYHESILVSQVLTISIAIMVFSTTKNSFILSKVDIKGFRNINIYMSIVRIGFSVALIPFLGVWGAVLSTVIYRVATLYIVDANLKKYIS